MIVADGIEETRRAVAEARRGGARIGFVPTMGALHDGHLSLIEACEKACDFTVVSIYVNPSQFGPNEDFDKYPRTFERDRELCEKRGADLIFCPSDKIMYGENHKTWVEAHGIQDPLEGTSRPGFFRGVATVVTKLFNIVQPDVAFFGQKDAQQAAIIRRIAADLNMPVEIRAMPIVREADGLAMSSRNAYLSAEGRARAAAINRALKVGARRFGEGVTDAVKLKKIMNDALSETDGLTVDYLAVCDPETFLERDAAKAGDFVLAAVHVEGVRLIDNIILN